MGQGGLPLGRRRVEGGSPPSEKDWASSFCKSNSSMIFAHYHIKYDKKRNMICGCNIREGELYKRIGREKGREEWESEVKYNELSALGLS